MCTIQVPSKQITFCSPDVNTKQEKASGVNILPLNPKLFPSPFLEMCKLFPKNSANDKMFRVNRGGPGGRRSKFFEILHAKNGHFDTFSYN